MTLRGTKSGSRVCVAAGAVVAVLLGMSAAGAQLAGPSEGKDRWIDRADAICRKAEGRRVKVATPPSLVGAVAVVTHGGAPNAKQRAALRLYFGKIVAISEGELTAVEGLRPPATEKSAVLDLTAEWEATQLKLARAVRLLKANGNNTDAAKALLTWGQSTTSSGAAAAFYGLLDCAADRRGAARADLTDRVVLHQRPGWVSRRGALRRASRCRGVRRAERDRASRYAVPWGGRRGALADEQCGPEFQSFVGIAVEDSVARLHAVHPQPRSSGTRATTRPSA